jgi:TnpA family transposase
LRVDPASITHRANTKSVKNPLDRALAKEGRQSFSIKSTIILELLLPQRLPPKQITVPVQQF